MNYNDIINLSASELTSKDVGLEAYVALKSLYSNSPPETRDEDVERFYFVESYIHHLTFGMQDAVRELEKIKNRTFMEKLKDLFSK